jgi:hypothetical protein
MLEIGFEAVEGVYSMQVVGFYEALKDSRAKDFSDLAIKVLEAIARKHGKAFGLKIWQETDPELLDTRLV